MSDGPGGDASIRERNGRRVVHYWGSGFVSDGGSTDESGADRHRILRQLRQQLEQHPAVEVAWGRPGGAYAEVEARVDPRYFGRAAESATLRLVWHPVSDSGPVSNEPDAETSVKPGPRTAFDAMFNLHYSEPGGYDCGFHNEPNPHVDGWFHFQERDTPVVEYRYTPESLAARTPASALWELLDKLSSKLQGESD